MRVDQQKRATRISLILLTIVGLATSYLSVSSLNPVDVYRGGGTGAKVFISIVAVMFGTTLVKSLFLSAFAGFLRIKAGQPAKDITCPGCGRNLLAYTSQAGDPIPCPRSNCRRIWHRRCFENASGHRLAGCGACLAEDQLKVSP